MSISLISIIAWFLLYGINHFAGIKAIGLILAIIAFIIVGSLIFERGRTRPGVFL